uniref:MICOS complex subunit MIC10 n=1 Tax=Ixodes ricinus TaxID=34613 RepID=A0A0K8RFJ3_IXORI
MATRSEDVLGEKWDKCIADTLIKMGAGLGVGVVFSLVLFKRRAWPVVFGLGSGFGMGYNQPRRRRLTLPLTETYYDRSVRPGSRGPLTTYLTER